jgi:GAF domain-containing protein
MLELRTVYSPDVTQDPEYELSDRQKLIGMRAVVVTPLLREGHPTGYLAFYKLVPGAFSNKHVELIETFADQAVIAIENARLFEELQSRTKELQQALEYQTATSEVFSVISRSPSDLQRVLDVIVETAVRLCQADVADVRLLRDGLYHIAATTENEPTRVKTLLDNPIVPGRSSVVGRVALERGTVHVADIHNDPEYNYAPGPNFPGMRAILGVPMLRDGVVIGVIVLFNSIGNLSHKSRSH